MLTSDFPFIINWPDLPSFTITIMTAGQSGDGSQAICKAATATCSFQWLYLHPVWLCSNTRLFLYIWRLVTQPHKYFTNRSLTSDAVLWNLQLLQIATQNDLFQWFYQCCLLLITAYIRYLRVYFRTFIIFRRMPFIKRSL